jgi:hypothetical protein
MEIKLIQKKPEKDIYSEFLLLRPSSLRRTPNLTNPAKHRISLTTYTSPGFLKNGLHLIYNQMIKTYGNIPLWVEYYNYPLSNSWNLGLIHADHSLFVYGEKEVVDEFISRFNDLTRKIQLEDSSDNNFPEHRPNESTNKTQNLASKSLFPREIRKPASPVQRKHDLIHVASIVLGMTALILEICLFKKRKELRKQTVTRQEALTSAISCVNEISLKKSELRSEKDFGDKWEFLISDYNVTVNKNGRIEKIKKVKEK